MGKVFRPQFERRRGPRWRSIVAAFAVGIALVLAGEPWLRKVTPPPAPALPTVTRLQTSTPQIPQKFDVVDGDTVRMGSTRYRLVGFNAPEGGTDARCPSERVLAAKATQRLQQLLASGEPYLKRIPCACKAGTEGTPSCNYGRLCGVLTVSGVDVAGTMIREGLAEPYVCGATSCPRRRNWCAK